MQATKLTAEEASVAMKGGARCVDMNGDVWWWDGEAWCGSWVYDHPPRAGLEPDGFAPFSIWEKPCQ